MKPTYFVPVIFALAACGGGGGSSSGSGAPAVPAPSAGTIAIALPSASPTPVPAELVAGTVVQIPADAYGPATIAGVTYASADAAQTTPLANAVVIVGPIPVTGATPPAQLPPGDVSATTNPAGQFRAQPSTLPAPASNVEPFVIPQNNILGFVPPATGYYIEVFGTGTDGKSAGAPIPLHRFVATSLQMTLRVSTTSAAEANALTTVNIDRAANGAGPLIFDESAEEVARLHASDATMRGIYICHYDANNIGPSSRYLAIGGIGLTGESVGITNASDALTALIGVESAFLSEKLQTPPGAHFANLVDVRHLWVGLGESGPAALGPNANFNFNVDYNFITPSAQDAVGGSSGYTPSGCANGIVNNGS